MTNNVSELVKDKLDKLNRFTDNFTLFLEAQQQQAVQSVHDQGVISFLLGTIDIISDFNQSIYD